MELSQNVMIGLLLLFLVVFILCGPSREHATDIKSSKKSKKSSKKSSKNKKSSKKSSKKSKKSSKKSKSVKVSPETKEVIKHSGLTREEVDSIIKQAIEEKSIYMTNMMGEKIQELQNSLGEQIGTKKICIGENENSCLTEADIQKLQGLSGDKLCLGDVCVDKNQLRAIGKSWIDKGCWRDDQTRVIPTMAPRENMTLNECKQFALENGANVLGMQNGNQCFIGIDSPYEKLGPAQKCNLRGDAWINRVYKLE
jgi:hypothetical protein